MNLQQTVRRDAWDGLGISRLATHTVKHTGQESGGELCDIFKFRSFLQLKSVNSVCKLFQLPYQGFASGPRCHWAIVPK